MRRSTERGNGRRGARAWLRRIHRWLGLAAVFFVLLLSFTGILLNHGADWGLDRRYVGWDWAIAALGIRAPEPAASFADRGHRVTQLGARAYFDRHEISNAAQSLTGLVVLEPLAVVATQDSLLLLTTAGEFVQQIDLTAELPAPVARIGRLDGRPVLDAGGELLIGDAEVSTFAPWPGSKQGTIVWSTASEPPAAEIAVLEDLYRGRGLTVERLLLEVHSGRILGAAGPLLLDLVAVVLIVLGISGVVVWLRTL